MYDELVKMLRTCSKRDSCIGWKESCPYLGTGACDNKAEKAADAIEELGKPKWIPVTERLPEEIGNYLVAINCPRGKWVEICACDGRDWVSVDEYAEYATNWVTHWMPLPQPPKEG